jgi:hypothetical protein
MRKVKCIVSILIGILLGLVSSCTSRNKPPEAPEPSPDEEAVGEKKDSGMPEKEKELPVRTIMYE